MSKLVGIRQRVHGGRSRSVQGMGLLRDVQGAGRVPTLVKQAQSMQLLGDVHHGSELMSSYVDVRPARPGMHHGPELYQNYIALGQSEAEQKAFDLRDSRVVAELKEALKALAAFEADPARSGPDPATEVVWKGITLNTYPYYDPQTADEYALAVSRYRNLWDIPPPYAQLTPVGPQPTVGGLEIIAGAANELLGGFPKLELYEAWRDGTFAPPSTWSVPDPNTPVIPSVEYGPQVRFPPPDVLEEHPGLAQAFAQSESNLQAAWMEAMNATNEQDRDFWATVLASRRKERDDVVGEAIELADIREGEEVNQPTIDACIEAGGSWSTAESRCVAKKAKASEEDEQDGLPLEAAAALGVFAAALAWAWRRRSAA